MARHRRRVERAHPVRKCIAALASVSVASAAMLPVTFVSSAGVRAQTTNVDGRNRADRPDSTATYGGMSRADYEACHAQDETRFRAAIEAVTHDALKRGTQRIDFGAIVRDEWRRLNFDSLIDTRVDLAISAVRQQTSWGQLIKSLAYREKATELATKVAEHVYRSDAVKSALDKLATGVGGQLGNAIELTAADAAQPAQACLRAFLGPRYGNAVAQVMMRDADAAFKINAEANRVSVSTGAVVVQATGGMAGAVILIVRRQLARMAQRLGQRLVGSVLSRVVSVVATGVGVVLIAKDVWDFRHGVLPIISTEMKASSTKAKVREELATAIQEQIARQLDTLARQSANQIMDIWRAFRRNHEKALELAERNTDFRKFLNAAPPERLGRLDELVGLALTKGGEQAVLARLSNGTLGRALNTLSEDGMQIAREQDSLEEALEWSELAPDKLGEVRRYELHKRARPSGFTSTSLKRLLALDNPGAIVRLAGVKSIARDRLFELSDAALVGLATRLSTSELGTLASYLDGLTKTARTRVLTVVAADPARMRTLSSVRVRDGIIASRNQAAAVDMMLRTDTGFDIAALTRDFEGAWVGDISPILLWEKHPVVIIGGLVGILMLLLLLRRVFSAPRTPAARHRAKADTEPPSQDVPPPPPQPKPISRP